MDTASISIISLVISGISVFIALLSFISNKAELIFFSDQNNEKPEAITDGEIKTVYISNKQRKRVNLPEGILYHVQILNPSPKDIAYFHMEFLFDKKPTSMITTNSFAWLTDKVRFEKYDPIQGSGTLPLPSEPQGVFKAHSFTPLYAFTPLEVGNLPQDVEFQFRYAVRKFPYIGKRNHYQTFKIKLDLSGTKESIAVKTKAMKQLTQQEQKLPKSKQTPPYSKRRKHNRRKK